MMYTPDLIELSLCLSPKGDLTCCAQFECGCHQWFNPTTGEHCAEDRHLCYKHRVDKWTETLPWDRIVEGQVSCHRCHTLPAEPEPISFNLHGLEVTVRLCEPCRTDKDHLAVFIEQVAARYRERARTQPRQSSGSSAGRRKPGWMQELGL